MHLPNQKSLANTTQFWKDVNKFTNNNSTKVATTVGDSIGKNEVSQI
jgi:hypothetical protein